MNIDWWEIWTPQGELIAAFKHQQHAEFFCMMSFGCKIVKKTRTVR